MNLRRVQVNEEHIILNDPVRPHISFDWRVQNGREIYALENEGKVLSVICVAYTKEVPESEDDMDFVGEDIAVAYTVWSYEKGAGQAIVTALRDFVKENKQCKRLVTLSPLTDMARRFHLKNGAKFLKKNVDTQNFEYEL